ncbi:16840_t:CDS:1, partial [Acaulospora morrowiae]
ENSGNMNYIVGRAILTPKNNEVEKISNLIMNWFPGEVYTYYSADSVGLEDGNVEQSQLYSLEFLRFLKICGLSPGELKLKVGIPIMLLRNLDPSKGL